jgi:hypothetical protein
MKKPKLGRGLVIGACTLVVTGLFASFALAATPPIAPGAVPPAGTESWMTSPCTACHTYTTPPIDPGTGTVTPPPPPVRTCGTCHTDPGVGVTPPREEHPFLYGATKAGGEHESEKANPKKHKHAKKHAKKVVHHVARKAKRVAHDS